MKKRNFLFHSTILLIAAIVLISALTSFIENIGTEESTLIPFLVSVVSFAICYAIAKNKKYIQFLNKIPEKDVKL